MKPKKHNLADVALVHFVFTHSISFRDFFLPQAWKKYYKTRYYQYPEALSKDSTSVGGRSWGKSVSIEASMVQSLITDFNCETLLTTFRRTHVKDREEAVIGYLQNVPYFRNFFIKGSIRRSVNRTPTYGIRLKNGHKHYGISVGDDPLAVAIQGHHAKKRWIDEAHTYPIYAWRKYQAAQDPTGSHDKYFGIADGRRDTPFWSITHELTKFKNKIFYISRRMESFFNQELKRDAIESFGGEDSDSFKQEIDASWSEPSFAAWDEEAIKNCFDPEEEAGKPGVLKNKLQIFTVSARQLKEGNLSPSQLLNNLPAIPANAEIIIGLDAGWRSPTTILPFYFYRNKWWLTFMIQFTDKMITDKQALFLDYIATRYNVNMMVLDTTSAEGRGIAQTLMNESQEQFKGKSYVDRIIDLDWKQIMVTGFKKDAQGKTIEVKERIKSGTVAILRRFFTKQKFNIYYHERILAEFSAESIKQAAGVETVKTPIDVHIPEATRCFIYGWWLKHENPKTMFRKSASIYDTMEIAGPELIELPFSILGRGGES